MGFRNEHEARFHRVRALETELENRDREIAELQAKLKGKKQRKKKPKKEGEPPADRSGRAGKNIPKVADLPEGDTWKMPVHRPYLWVVGLAMIVISVGVGWLFGVQRGLPWGTIAAIAVVCNLPALYTFHRKHLILDKRAGTITTRNSLLGVPWSSVVHYRGQHLRVKLRTVRSRDEADYTAADVFLGKTRLLTGRESRTVPIAWRIAAFLELHYEGPRPGR